MHIGKCMGLHKITWKKSKNIIQHKTSLSDCFLMDNSKGATG